MPSMPSMPPTRSGRRSASRERPSGPAAALLLAAVAGACRAPDEHRAEADQEVYSLVEERRAVLFGDGLALSIEPPADSLRARLLSGAETGPIEIDLVAGLEIAAENSREYRFRREALYLAALDLTLERWRFTVQERGSLGAQFDRSAPGVEELSADGQATLSRLFGTGALMVGDIGLELFAQPGPGRRLGRRQQPRALDQQPLLRGFGREVVQEPLTQAERDLVYEVRAYERFRRTFAVDVAARIYRILQQADVVKNERANLANLELLRQRNEALAAAGRLSDIQVDQARQDELQSRERLISEEQRYDDALDAFKLFLGLPIAEPRSRCDPAELARLGDRAELRPRSPGGAAGGAGARRAPRLPHDPRPGRATPSAAWWSPPMRCARGSTSSRTSTCESEEGRPLDLSSDDSTATIGIDLDLPIDRLPERNAYRAAEIELEAARRAAEEQADSIRADLRALLREALATLATFEIQQGAVALAERRVESARLRLDAGRADTRDILEAQEDLLEAQNAATAARINHRLSELALFRDLEILRLDARGLAVDHELLQARTEGG